MDGEPLLHLGLVARARPEDFRVEELPVVAASGGGEHVLLQIEKRGIDTRAAVRRLSARLGVAPGEFGRAGLKDARAVTRQALTVRGVEPAAVLAAGDEDLRVLTAERHREKLRPGQLAGNRFTLVLRSTEGGAVPPAAAARVRLALERIAGEGLANDFGVQRLGPEHRTARAGIALLRDESGAAVDLLCGTPTVRDRGAVREARERFAKGDVEGAARTFPASHRFEAGLCSRLAAGAEPDTALAALPRDRRALHLHAAQALLFQSWLARRREQPAGLLAGDVVRKVTGRGTFRVADPVREQPRSDRFEIVPMGPLFGRKMFPAEGDARALELELLAGHGLDEAHFERARLGGGRRALRVPVTEVAAPELVEDDLGPGLRLRFALPPGAYATSLLAQL